MPTRIVALLAATLLIAACHGDDPSSQDMAVTVQDFATSFDFTTVVHDLSNADAFTASCPTGTIPPSTATLFASDTAFNKNLVTNTRVQWGADSDAALLYVAPMAGTYRISVTSTDQPTTNDCGVVVRAYGTANNGAFYDETACPAAAAVKAIDGAYAATPAGSTADIDLSNGQHLLMFVSCSMFASPKKTMGYSVHVDLQ
jgi:hypothetical protein